LQAQPIQLRPPSNTFKNNLKQTKTWHNTNASTAKKQLQLKPCKKDLSAQTAAQEFSLNLERR